MTRGVNRENVLAALDVLRLVDELELEPVRLDTPIGAALDMRLRGIYSASMPKDDKKSRSGTTRTYAERKAKGRPISSFTVSEEARTILSSLAARLELSKSAVIELAVRELQKKYR